MIKKIICTFIITTIISTSLLSYELPIYSQQDVIHPTRGTNGMVSVANKYAADAGIRVLKNGGNAIDAAVTVAFVLAVTTPQAGNLGGGGFMLIHLAKNKKTIALDYREKAPKLAHHSLFLNERGELDLDKTRYSFLSAGVPGTVHGLLSALENYGTLSLKEVLQPAINLAENGFIVDEQLHVALKKARRQMKKFAPSFNTFYKKDGSVYNIGDTLIQPELAWTLKQIQTYGKSAFYNGPISQKIIRTMKENGGIITSEDLNDYSSIEREPIKGSYRGYTILSMPPPSSGGAHLIQILNIMEGFPIKQLGHNSADTIHILTESMKFAFADRSKHMGDSDFVPVPLKGLISKKYAATLRKQINMNEAIPSRKILPNDNVKQFNNHQTNHFSIIDRYGNAISNTYTLNFSFGSKLIVPGAGFLLNNQMDDFAAKPGIPNAYGLISSAANSIAPDKRMLSSMTPTIVMRRNSPYLITGSPGGSHIISTVAQVISNVIDHGMNISEATYATRVHHQWHPDVLRVERHLNRDSKLLLEAKQHTIVEGNAMGSAQSIHILNDVIYGAADPRTPGGMAISH